MQYQRNDTILTRGSFRVRGEVLEVFPAYAESAYRINLFGDEVESITHFDPLTGEVLDEVDHVSVWPATHYVTKEETIERAVDEIRFELEERVEVVRGARARTSRRTGCASAPQYDLEMLKELGFCNGIENYSRILDDRPAGLPAAHADRLLPRATSSSSSTSRTRRCPRSAACTRATARAS